MIWTTGVVFVVGVVVATLNAQQTKTNFSCDGRTSGYYADVETGCQIYHMCDGLGRQFSYTCPNATLFQQRMLICDHWYMVNCSKSEDDYSANLLIGQREKPFVEDSVSHPYHRTPRPDLLSHPTASEYNIIYRTGKAQSGTNQNLVGAESDNNDPSNSDDPTYFVPNHWSTEYSQQSSTEFAIPIKDKFKKNVPKRKPAAPITDSPVSSVNYKSYYKNTTPVFPKSVDLPNENINDFGLNPPLFYQTKSEGTQSQKYEPKEVLEANSKSDLIPDSNLGGESQSSTVKVIFESDFINTTPVYPKSVESTSPDPSVLGLLPPIRYPRPFQLPAKSESPQIPADTNQNRPKPLLSLNFEPPIGNTPQNNVENNKIPVDLPSKFYQPPKFEPNYRDIILKEDDEDGSINRKRDDVIKPLNSPDQWNDLRKKFLIPDYEFPLDTVSRPSYDTVLSSFQAYPSSPSEK